MNRTSDSAEAHRGADSEGDVFWSQSEVGVTGDCLGQRHSRPPAYSVRESTSARCKFNGFLSMLPFSFIRLRVTLGVLALLLCVATSCPAQNPDTLAYSLYPTLQAKQDGAMQGHAVAVDGNIAAIGSPYDNTAGQHAGGVKIYDIKTGALLESISNPDPSRESQFGVEVALSGSHLAVLSFSWVYVYDLSAQAPIARLSSRLPYGGAIAASGSLVAIGRRQSGTNSAQVSVYDLAGASPTEPIQTILSPVAGNSGFGTSVALSGTSLVVDAPGVPSLYVYDTAGATLSIPTAVLNRPQAGGSECKVVISGTRILLGDPNNSSEAVRAGACYVYDLANPEAKDPVLTLNCPGAKAGAQFGSRCSIDGTRIVVGAPYQDGDTEDEGGSYVYDLASQTPTVPVAILKNPVPAYRDYFGDGVSMCGTKAVVGASGKDVVANDAGAAYVFDLQSSSPAIPVLTLDDPGPQVGDQFGSAVAIDGATMAVGSPMDDTAGVNSGACLIYDLSGPSPSTPTLTLTDPGTKPGDNFGQAVAVSGSLVAVGAPGDDSGAADSGKVYIYDALSAAPGVPVLVLSNPSPGAGDAFGRALAMSGSRLVVGTPYDDPIGPLNTYTVPNAGSVYVYDLSTATPAVPILRLSNVTSQLDTSNSMFGASVAIDGVNIIVGAPGERAGSPTFGYAYLFDASLASTTRIARFTWPSGRYESGFGRAVAIAGDRIAVSADRLGTETVSYSTTGGVCIFDIHKVIADHVTPDTVLYKPSGAPGEKFGSSIGLSGARLLVGSPVAQSSVGQPSSSGEAYLYDLTASTPTTPISTFKDSFPEASANFGGAIAVKGAVAMVGASLSDAIGTDRGAVYVYRPQGVTAPSAPVLSSPVSGAIFREQIDVSYSLPVAAYSQSVKLIFRSGSGAVRTLVLAPEFETPGQHSIGVQASDLRSNSGVLTAVGGNSIPNGDYSIAISYQDTADSWPVSASAQGVVIEALTQPGYYSASGYGRGTPAQPGYYVPTAGAKEQTIASPGYYVPTAGQSSQIPAEPGYYVPTAGAKEQTPASHGYYVPTAGQSSQIPAEPGNYVPTVGAKEQTIASPGYYVPTAGQSSQTAAKPGYYVSTAEAKEQTIASPGYYVPTAGQSVQTAADAGFFAPGAGATSQIANPAGTWSHPASRAVRSAPKPRNRSSFIVGPVWSSSFESGSIVNLGSLSDVASRSLVILNDSSDLGGDDTLTALGITGIQVTGKDAGLVNIDRPIGSLLHEGNATTLKVAISPGGPELHSATITIKTDIGAAPGGVGEVKTIVYRWRGVSDEPARDVRTMASTGTPVPGSGVDSRIVAGSEWTSFGVPAVNESGNVAFLARWKVPPHGSAAAQSETGIFVDDTLVVRAGQPVAGMDGVKWKSFTDPVIDDLGSVAFIGTITGTGVSSSNDKVVTTNSFGSLQILAREGNAALGCAGTVWQSFSSVSLQARSGASASLVFTGMLKAGSSGMRLTPANNSGAWWVTSDSKPLANLVVRTGDPIAGGLAGEKVKTFTLLKTTAGSPGQGRGHRDPSEIVFSATLSTGRSALIGATAGETSIFASTGDLLGSTALPQAKWKKFGAPIWSEVGVAQRADLEEDVNTSRKGKPAAGIFLSRAGEENWEPMVRVGDPAPGLGDRVIFKTISDPVMAVDRGGLAFCASMGAAEAAAQNSAGIWWKPEGGQLSLIAREGGEPPSGVPGAKWEKFTSLALPGGGDGPLFTALLKNGPGGITAEKDLGLFATDSSGVLHEVLREGSTIIDGGRVRSFSVLKAIPGSPGVSRAFNSHGQVAVRVTFVEGTSGILLIGLP